MYMQQDVQIKLSLTKVLFVDLYYTIILQCTVRKKTQNLKTVLTSIKTVCWTQCVFLVYAIDICVYFTSTSCFLTLFLSFFYLPFFISSLCNRRESISTVPSPITVHTLFLTNTLFRRNVFFLKTNKLFFIEYDKITNTCPFFAFISHKFEATFVTNVALVSPRRPLLQNIFHTCCLSKLM